MNHDSLCPVSRDVLGASWCVCFEIREAYRRGYDQAISDVQRKAAS